MRFVLPGLWRDHSPALAWLSLVGLLASRAPLRFTRRDSVYEASEGKEKVHPVGFSVKMVLKQIVFPESPQDATEDYPQSGRAFQVIRLL